MSKELEGEICSLHLVRPFTEDELRKLSRGFALAVWVDLDSRKILDSTIYPARTDSTADTWHHCCTVWVSRGDRIVTIDKE